MELRDYQHRMVGDIRAAFAGGSRRVLAVAPTGSGKTVIFCFVARGVAAKGRRVTLCAHRIEIVEQIGAALAREGVAHGFIAPGRPETDHPVQVGMVQTIANRLGRLPRPDMLVVDEAHHATAGTYQRIATAWPVQTLGVTASPARTDGQGLGDVFDLMVVGPPMRMLIDQGYLSDFVVYAPPRVVDLSGVSIRAGDYARDELAAAMDRAAVTGDSVKHYARHLAGAPAIAFCASVAHAEHVAQQFRDVGYRAASVDGGMDADERRRRIAAIGDGALQVLASCDIVSEGTDIPAVSGALLLRPTQSIIVYLQQVGRVLRTAPGKERAVILDHVGNCMRLGLPDAVREWSLAQRKRRGPPDTLPVRQCPQCFACHAPAAKCPACGHAYASPRRRAGVADGDLVQIPETYSRLRDAPIQQLVREARSLDALHDIARARNYNSGWAFKMWQLKREGLVRRKASA